MNKDSILEGEMIDDKTAALWHKSGCGCVHCTDRDAAAREGLIEYVSIHARHVRRAIPEKIAFDVLTKAEEKPIDIMQYSDKELLERHKGNGRLLISNKPSMDDPNPIVEFRDTYPEEDARIAALQEKSIEKQLDSAACDAAINLIESSNRVIFPQYLRNELRDAWNKKPIDIMAETRRMCK